MRRGVLIPLAVLVAAALLVGCGAASKVGVKKTAKKAATEARVEVLEVKMEKETWVSAISGKQHGVKVTGKAVYHPAKVGGKPFKDVGGEFAFGLYDANGLKLPEEVGVRKEHCGEYSKPENVVPNKPFPFEYRTSIAGEDEPEKMAIWERVSSIKFLEWRR